MALNDSNLKSLVRYYNTESRERIDGALAKLDELSRLQSLGLLAHDATTRIDALRWIQTRPMRLYGYVESVDRDNLTVLDAQCAETYDHRVAHGLSPLDPNDDRDFLLVGIDTHTLAKRLREDVQEGRFLELTLVRQQDTSDLPDVRVKRTAPGRHPAVDGVMEYMALKSVRVVEQDDDQEFETTFFAYEAPSWAQDPANGDTASACGRCGAWLTVVRPGKTQCDNCNDGQDIGDAELDAINR